jgi:glucose-6-phosphate-specific signal transduction histidine kinase
MLAVSCVLLTAGALALLVPFFILNAICVTAKLCEVSLFAEAANQAFTKHALHSPLPELLLVVPFLVGIAVALRNPYWHRTQNRGRQHAA